MFRLINLWNRIRAEEKKLKCTLRFTNSSPTLTLPEGEGILFEDKYFYYTNRTFFAILYVRSYLSKESLYAPETKRTR